ncbi:MAG: peptidoglycan-binding protein [Phycisphaeraceae bacterium]
MMFRLLPALLALLVSPMVAAAGTIEVFGRVGDLIRVDLKAARGGTSFDLGSVIGGGFEVLTSDDVEGLPFAQTGRFYVVPGVVNTPRRSTESILDRGFQGTVQVPVTIDGLAQDVAVTVRPGFTYDGPLRIPNDGSSVAVAAAQQRLNFLGYQKAGGGSLVVDGLTGAATQSAVRLFQAVVTATGEVNPGGFSGNLDAGTVAYLNLGGTPEWVNLIDPDLPSAGGQRGGGSVVTHPNGVRGNFDIWTSTSERYASSWTIDTVLAASEAMPGQHINAMTMRDGVGSVCCHSTHQAGLDIDVHIPSSVWNYGNGSLSADELEAVAIMRAFYENTPSGARVWRIIVSNNDVREEFNRQTGTSVAVGDSSGVHLNHLHIDLQRTRPASGPSVADGDLDLDDVLTVADIDLLGSNLGGDPFYFDLTGDGVVDGDDLDELVWNEFGTVYGDANLDGGVDLIDLSSLAGGFGLADLGWGGGDFNADGMTDLIDLSLLAGNFGGGQGVPEPVGQLAFVLATTMLRRKPRC